MKYINKFDYIVENMAQARAILNRTKNNYDNPVFQEIVKETKRDGYTGFITKLVFEMGFNKEDALKIYKKIKDEGTDVGALQKASADDIEKILSDKEPIDYEYIFTENGYKVFLINNYNGILKTGSPAWCLKTKSYWDNYITKKEGMQFVIINEKFAPSDDLILMTTPSDWDGEKYESGSYAKMRFGITSYLKLRMLIFDDNNRQISFNEKYDFLDPILNKIHEYDVSHRVIKVKRTDIDDYLSLRDLIINTFDDLDMRYSFSYLIRNEDDIDSKFKNFYEAIKENIDLDKHQLFDKLSKFIDEIVKDEEFLENNGYVDIFVNDFVTYIKDDSLPNFPNVTSNELPLGGYLFNEFGIGESVIKYHYGYQYTKYGRAAIEQNYGTVEKFYSDLANNFNEILTETEITGMDIFKDVYDKEDFKNEIKTSINSEKYKDGYIIKIDTEKLYNIAKESDIELGKISITDDKGWRYKEINNVGDFLSLIKYNLSYFSGITYDGKELSVPIYSIKD